MRTASFQKAPMGPSYNQRTYTRIDVDFSVTVSPDEGEAFDAILVDISAGGLRIEHATRPKAGVGVQCSFFGDTHTLIEVRGVVCSVDASSFGVRLTGYDTVSYAHLKGLLLRLADDPHALEDEILLNLDHLPEAD